MDAVFKTGFIDATLIDGDMELIGFGFTKESMVMLDEKPLGTINDLILKYGNDRFNLKKSIYRVDTNFHIAKSGILEVNDLEGTIFINEISDEFTSIEAVSDYLVEHLEYDDNTNTYDFSDESGLMEFSGSIVREVSYYSLLENGKQYAYPIK